MIEDAARARELAVGCERPPLTIILNSRWLRDDCVHVILEIQLDQLIESKNKNIYF